MSSGGSTPATTNQVSKVELPAWVNQASEENYGLAKQIGSRPLEQYQGQTVAGPSSMTTQGWDAIKNNIGSMQPYYDKAMGLLDKSSSFQDQAASQFGTAGNTYDQYEKRP